MKNQTLKIITILSILLIAILGLTTTVKAEGEKGSIILKKAEEEYIVYYEEICNSEFQFALSTNEKESEENLIFINSVKDKETEKALNVAYINSKLYTQFFENEEKAAYIWIRDMEGKELLAAKKISLNDVIDDEMINFVDTTTKRIAVDTTKTHRTQADINGVDTTVTVGKVVVKEDAGSEYSYKLVKADEANAKEKEFFELAETIQKGTDDTYTSLNLSKNFYKLYNELEPKAEEWEELKNSEILQPETTRDGDKYVVWLKQENEDEEIVDAKFLVSIYEYEPKYEKEDKVIEEVVRTPVTYDSPVLIITFVVVIIAIILVVILKIRANKKQENK